jgi:hypothetical protein
MDKGGVSAGSIGMDEQWLVTFKKSLKPQAQNTAMAGHFEANTSTNHINVAALSKPGSDLPNDPLVSLEAVYLLLCIQHACRES